MAERVAFNGMVAGSIPVWDYLTYEPPAPTYDDADPFWGEYGTNARIPGISQWVKDMRIPYWIAEMRNMSKR